MTELDAIESAEGAGVRHVSDTIPGVRRRRVGKGFSYIGPDDVRITDPNRLVWFRRLAIPPAWTDVWICPVKRGHLQATGRDARGRKVYRHHPRWRAVRDEVKYEHTLAFGRALPQIRRRVDEDLARRGLPREKLPAVVVRLLEKTRIRVGNEEYARENRSFGLTTLRDRHADVGATQIRFNFKGKAGKVHRTWAGTVLAAWALKEFEQVDSEAQVKKNVVRAIETVAEQLENTPAVSRKSYVHPEVIDAYLDGDVVREVRERADGKLGESLSELGPEEAAVLALLRQRLAHEERRAG